METGFEDSVAAQFILGNKRVIDNTTKEELLNLRRQGCHNLDKWSECFVLQLINTKTKMDDFIQAYTLFLGGDKEAIINLNLLPPDLEKSKRHAIAYLEALAFVTFKKDLQKIIRPKPPLLERIGDPQYC